MEKKHILLLIFFSLFLLKPIADAKDNCSPVSCGPNEPEIRFPFRILGRQSNQCGFSGFDIFCDEQNKTIILLPLSLTYIVNKISYLEQVIYIDPEFCLPNRIVSVNMTNTPFRSHLWMQSYTFYNCSLQNNHSFNFSDANVPFPCLSNGNDSIIAVESNPWISGHMPSSCKVMTTIDVPVGFNSDFGDQLEMMWFTPFCRSCESEGKACRLKSDDNDNGDGQTICVSRGKGISRIAMYGLSVGICGSTLICIMVFKRYASSRVQAHDDSNNQGIGLSTIAIIRQPASKTGLDGSTIESYPKTVFGESCRLPNDDATCAICLSDYKSKESLRTIPECNHYFHVECIDEWLKLNATCPVCRKTQESSTLVTRSKASSSSSVDLS
ncbi:unnamed protein product [Lactuca virosa]|uniref:RING-type E3 ubiquitin transferase n=1 Tax=Lactuca virosa TaxID=75947 RepID=A0AAU9PN71_9ASTR|nr:unnamed protein product [Lactuca virosa]